MEAVLGIDIAKASFAVTLLAAGEASHAHFSNDGAGFAKLTRWLHKRQIAHLHACMEATGAYWEALADYLHAQGHVVSVVNPARIKAFAESHLARNKTDQLDAHLIARFCHSQQPLAWTPPPPEQRALQALVRQVEALQQMRQQEVNRLAAGVEVAAVVAALQAHIAFIEEQIAQLLQQIEEHIQQHPHLREQRELLVSIPGIGKRTALTLLAEIVEVTRFSSAPQLAAYAGVSPRQRRSGSSVHGRTRLCKTGNAALRKALYFPAIVARRHNPLIRTFCDRLAQRGKTKMQIIGAAMRKLLHLVYGVLKSGQPFDPNYLQVHVAT